jgi:superkiller protein 3
VFWLSSTVLINAISGTSPPGADITAEYQKAVKEVNRQDFHAALNRLRTAVAQAPQFYQAYNLMGVCYERLGNHIEAHDAFVQSLKINPEFDEAHVNLGANLVAQGRVVEGIAQFQKAIRLNPRSVSAFFNLGITEAQHGEPDKAVTSLKNAYRLSPDPTILLALANTLIKADRIKEALQYEERASKAPALDPPHEMQLGILFLGAQQCQVAQRHLTAAAEADSRFKGEIGKLSEHAFDDRKYAEALCLLGVERALGVDSADLHSMVGACQYHLQNPVQAVAEVQRSIQIDPGNEDYYIQLAQIFIDYNTPEAAIQLLEPAVTRFPHSARIRYVLGVSCLKTARMKDAEQHLKGSLQLRPRDPLALGALAVLYEGVRNWDSLLDVSKSIIGLPQHAAEGYYYQAEAYFNLLRGQPSLYPEVESLVKKCVTMQPNSSSAHLLLARFLIERGSYSEAVESLKRAIALDPQSENAYYHLALAYGKLGETQKQSEAFEKFKALSQQGKKPEEKKLYYEIVREKTTRN